jgi:predicted signal transduction protein with EAL and GGDEF domain
MRQSKPEGAFCGRLAGDEIIVAMKSGDFDVAMRTLKDVLALLSRPAWVAGRAVQVGASGGVVQAPAHGDARDELIRKSNIAQRAAKRTGRGRLVAFEPGMDSELKNRRAIERDLKRAIAEETLDLHYQPIVTASRAAIVGVEALLRWHHPQEGAIPPPVFVSLAEQAGLMDALGEFVLRRALTDAKRWPDLYISVNVSPLQVRDRTFVWRVGQLLRDAGIPPSRLVIEITESVLIEDPEDARTQLDALRALGVKVALDDFGTGFSSLSYLQRFTCDKLKIDKSFVAPLGGSAHSGPMIQAIVALGNALGMTILAEGVETEEQRVLLRLAGCHEMQGFLFAKPMPREGIDRMLENKGTRIAMPGA